MVWLSQLMHSDTHKVETKLRMQIDHLCKGLKIIIEKIK
jgi:hypothetical protein